MARAPVRSRSCAVQAVAGGGGFGDVAAPADLVARGAQGDEDVAGGGGGAALEGGECLGEEVCAVGEGAALGEQEAGAGGVGGRPAAVASGGSAASPPAVAGEERAEDRRVGAAGVVSVRPVHQGLPPDPTRVMISQRARSSKTREVGIRTVVRCLPVTGCPARLVQ
ncbi:hypothetical protein GCM10020000_66230 [Streptomyces olivoverticillatus]